MRGEKYTALACYRHVLEKSPNDSEAITGLKYIEFKTRFLGILIYLIYNNLLNVAKKWVERGDVPNWIGIWWVHLVLLLIIKL
jgi:hypothetical protein